MKQQLLNIQVKKLNKIPSRVMGVLLSISCLLVFRGCGEVNPSNIPTVPVDINLNIYDPQFVNLLGTGGAVFIEGGVRGIVVYRASIDQFNAYERYCPYNTHLPCGKVSLHSSGIMLVDDDCSGEGCGSKFNIIDGSVIEGPASYPLLRYNTYFDGAIVRIFN